MDLAEAAVWVDVLAANPDRCLIAADWFEEKNRPEIGRMLRGLAADGQESAAAHSLETIYFGHRAQARSAYGALVGRGVYALLKEFNGLNVTVGEPLKLVQAPPRGHTGSWRIPEFQYHDYRVADAGDLHVSSTFKTVTLYDLRCGGQVTWRGVRQSWFFWIWVGRSDSGLLHHTPFPPSEELTFGQPVPVLAPYPKA